jgi:hypothetical protein
VKLGASLQRNTPTALNALGGSAFWIGICSRFGCQLDWSKVGVLKKGYSIHSTDSIVKATDVPSKRPVAPKELQGKRGPKDKHPWNAIKATVFSLMNSHREFCRARDWYQAKLIDRVLDELAEELADLPEVSTMKRRLPGWLGEWRAAQK